ncbi:ubiquitin-like domain-containing protein stuxnet [Haematobia irritans]|uniref:ubiquitin-like domain-containing protein stuxnet n=1 Tax=Haematobia irritans TaxID=7368 RepID=UPI003F4FFE37
MEKTTDSNSASSPSSSSSSSTLSSGNSGSGDGTASTATQQHVLNSSNKTGAGGSQATTNTSDGNQQQTPHPQHHEQPVTTTTTTFMQNDQNNSSSPSKNQLNSLGCGPPATSSSTATFANSGNLKASNGSTIIKTTSPNSAPFSIASSLSHNNSTTLGHQSCTSAVVANTNTTNNTSIPLASSNGVGSAASAIAITSTSSTAPTTSPPTSSQMAPINLNISTTTGGNFSVSVDPQITVENLKKIIAKKLKVAKDRICLLHREKELQDGSLKENNLMDGSKIILIPNVETGLLAQRPENTVMQALESLNDSQVNDFLSGKTPLNLSMRLGDHMMLIQLQLSTVNPVNGTGHGSSNCSSSSRTRSSHHHHHHHHRSSSSRSASTTSTATQTSDGSNSSNNAKAAANHSHHHHHHHHHHHNNSNIPGSIASANTSVVAAAQNTTTAVRKLELDSSNACQTRTNANNTTSPVTATKTPMSSSTRMQSIANNAPLPLSNSSAVQCSSTASPVPTPTKSSDLSSFLSKRDYESLQNIVKSIAMAQPSRLPPPTTVNASGSGSAPQPAASSTIVPVASPIVPVATTFHAPSTAEAALLEQSPIKSLSNLVSSPIKTTPIKNIPRISNSTNSSSNIVNSVALGPHSSAMGAATATVAPASSICQDPIAAKLTSCLCTRLNGGSSTINMPPHSTSKQCIETSCISQQQQSHTPQLALQQTPHQCTSSLMTSTPNYKATNPNAILTPPPTTGSNLPSSSSSSRSSSSSLHKTAHNVISRKHRHHHHHHHHHHHYHHPGVQNTNVKLQPSITSTPTRGVSNDSGFNSGDDSLNISTQSPIKTKTTASTAAAAIKGTSSMVTPVVVAAPLTSVQSVAAQPSATPTTTPLGLDESGIVSDSRTLAEASRNLTQTLRKLSKEVFTNKIDFSASEETPRKNGSGAVIESMKNHGKGIYSGTFSGTLNPALQDRYGRPKRDISTVIHILNDLLSATPQYHRGARISFEAPSTSAAAAASVAAASGSPGAIHHSSRSKHLSSKHHHSSHPCVKCIKTHNSSSSSVSANSNSGSVSHATTNANVSSTSSSSSVCTYSECNGHYSSKSLSSKSYACCHPDLASTPNGAAISQSNGGSSSHNGHHHSSHHHHHHHQMVDERKVCQCRYRIHSETGEREREHTCQKCATEMDNLKTKSKLDQLRLVMQQRKQKREARKLKGAPYGARVVGATTTATAAGVVDAAAASALTASNNPISSTQPISVASATTTTPSEVSPNHIVEEVDTAA